MFKFTRSLPVALLLACAVLFSSQVLCLASPAPQKETKKEQKKETKSEEKKEQKKETTTTDSNKPRPSQQERDN